VDRASMAHSLEVRVPFLDHPLVEWAASLPPELRLNARGSKRVLRSALSGDLPAAVLRRRKMGFAVPLAAWLRGPLLGPVRKALAEPALAEAGLLDMRAVERLIEDHEGGGSDHSRTIWALFMLAGFLHRVHGCEQPLSGVPRASREPSTEPAEPR